MKIKSPYGLNFATIHHLIELERRYKNSSILIMTSINETESHAFSKEIQDCSPSEFQNTFILKGNKVKLNFISDTELLIQQCSGCGISSIICTNSCKKSEIILLENIISIRSKNSASQVGIKPNLSYRILVEFFVIDYVSKNNNHKWKLKSLCFRHIDRNVVSSWKEKLEKRLSSISLDRPKNLLIFVNPFGGKGKGPKIFHKKIVPLLRLSGINFEVFVTEHANHAKETLQECSLEGIHGVVSVGGDGIFSEIFTGMLLRAEKESDGDFTQLKKGNVRVGVIPTGKLAFISGLIQNLLFIVHKQITHQSTYFHYSLGSSDAIALSHHGTRCPVTATLHILLGDRLYVDVMRIMENFNGEEKFALFSLAMVSYGFVGDLLKSSETIRYTLFSFT